jgi:hypothetical protein
MRGREEGWRERVEEYVGEWEVRVRELEERADAAMAACGREWLGELSGAEEGLLAWELGAAWAAEERAWRAEGPAGAASESAVRAALLSARAEQRDGEGGEWRGWEVEEALEAVVARAEREVARERSLRAATLSRGARALMPPALQRWLDAVERKAAAGLEGGVGEELRSALAVLSVDEARDSVAAVVRLQWLLGDVLDTPLPAPLRQDAYSGHGFVRCDDPDEETSESWTDARLLADGVADGGAGGGAEVARALDRNAVALLLDLRITPRKHGAVAQLLTLRPPP